MNKRISFYLFQIPVKKKNKLAGVREEKREVIDVTLRFFLFAFRILISGVRF